MKVSYYILPVFILVIIIFSIIKKKNAYQSFVLGVSEGMKNSISIFPTMLAMYSAIELIAACGIIDDIFPNMTFPKEFFLQGLFRPFSSQASLSYMVKIYTKYGVDSNISYISSILQGAVDSSVYVMSLYFGACNIVKTKKSFLIGILINLFSFFVCLIIYILLEQNNCYL